MKLKTLTGIIAGKSAQALLKSMGRGSTYPGKLALQFDKAILDTLAKDYEIVVVTGTNGKTLTTALTVGILSEAFGEVLTNPSGANMITGIVSTFLTAKKAKQVKKLLCLKLMKLAFQKSLSISHLVFLSSQTFSVTKWTDMEKSTPPIK